MKVDSYAAIMLASCSRLAQQFTSFQKLKTLDILGVFTSLRYLRAASGEVWLRIKHGVQENFLAQQPRGKME